MLFVDGIIKIISMTTIIHGTRDCWENATVRTRAQQLMLIVICLPNANQGFGFSRNEQTDKRKEKLDASFLKAHHEDLSAKFQVALTDFVNACV